MNYFKDFYRDFFIALLFSFCSYIKFRALRVLDALIRSLRTFTIFKRKLLPKLMKRFEKKGFFFATMKAKSKTEKSCLEIFQLNKSKYFHLA